MQTTKFSFELPNDRTDLIDIANFLVQKAKSLNSSKNNTKNLDEKEERLKRFQKTIGLIQIDKYPSLDERDEIRAKR